MLAVYFLDHFKMDDPRMPELLETINSTNDIIIDIDPTKEQEIIPEPKMKATTKRKSKKRKTLTEEG